MNLSGKVLIIKLIKFRCEKRKYRAVESDRRYDPNVPSHGFPHPHLISMSPSSSNPNVSSLQFEDLLDAALWEYTQKTGKDIATDPLASRFSDCRSSDAVLDILEKEAEIFDEYREGQQKKKDEEGQRKDRKGQKGDRKDQMASMKVQIRRRLKPTVDILFWLSTSDVVVECASLVRLPKLNHPLLTFIDVHHPPCRYFHQRKQCLSVLVSYSRYASLPPSPCICNLDTQTLKATKGVSTSYDTLIELFEHFERFLGRLKVLTEIPLAMGEILVKIIVELLKVLTLTTQQINQGRFSECVLVDTCHAA